LRDATKALTFQSSGQDARDLYRTRVVRREHVGWMEGPVGVGALHFS
jgi:hypothetical protein